MYCVAPVQVINFRDKTRLEGCLSADINCFYSLWHSLWLDKKVTYRININNYNRNIYRLSYFFYSCFSFALLVGILIKMILLKAQYFNFADWIFELVPNERLT